MAEASGTRALLEEDETNTVCVSCIEIGNLKAANTYCVNGGNYLCNMCVEKHQREESSNEQEEQELPDKEQECDTLTSPDDIDKKTDECVERCVIHVKQVMEYYCEDHQKLCCTACIMLEHTTCSKTYIPTDSGNIFKSQVYREFKADIQGFIKNSHDNQNKLDKTLEMTLIEESDKLDDIRKQREAVNACFDKIEENLKRQCRQAYLNNKNHVDEVIKENKKLLEGLDKMFVEMTTKEQNNQMCQVYVKLKQWQHVPTLYTQRLEDIRTSGRVQSYKFEPSDYFEEQDSYFLGRLILQTEHVDAKHNSETSCDISDIAVLPNGTIALADFENESVKVMHPSRLQVTPELMYNARCPVGLAKSSMDQFAVSSNDGQIKVIEVSSLKLTFVRELYPPKFIQITANSLCYTKKGIIVAQCPRDTKFVYVSGDRSSIASFFTRKRDNLNATPERFATCRRSRTTIYRTQKHLSKLIHQQTNGDILNTYEHKQLPSPCGVAVSSNGTVYVCDDETHTIHVLTPDLYLKRILEVDFGGAKPRSMAVCNKFELLYVCTDGDFICILRLPALS